MQRVVGRERWHQEGAVFGHQRSGLCIEQIAVLDRPHAAADRPADRLWRVGMGHHVGACGTRFLDDRGHLLNRVLRAVERIARRGAPPPAITLIWWAPLRSLLAHRTPHLADAVGDAAEQTGRATGDAAHAEATLEVRRPHIAMAARLGDRPAGDEHPRADEGAALDGLHQARIGAAGVAHRGEATPRIASRMSFDCAATSDCGCSERRRNPASSRSHGRGHRSARGSSVRPPRSKARAPARGAPWSPTALIRSPSTVTAAPARRLPLALSNRRAL